MADALLKSGEIVQVPIDQIEEYMYANLNEIQPREVIRRGRVRKTTNIENNSSSTCRVR